MPAFAQFSHLSLQPCARCRRVCQRCAETGVDCTGRPRLPDHACFPCTVSGSENFACPNYRAYGLDCHGGFPEHLPAPARTKAVHAEPASRGHRRRPSSATNSEPVPEWGTPAAAALARRSGHADAWPSVGILPPPDAPQGPRAAARSMRAGTLAEVWTRAVLQPTAADIADSKRSIKKNGARGPELQQAFGPGLHGVRTRKTTLRPP